MQILLVDDEVALTEPLTQVLEREGYQVDVANDGTQGLAIAQAGHYQLLILDWLMPGDISGLEICRRLRAQDKTVPVLFLTAKDTLDDRVLGLDAGADDYLVKPFELRELLARVRALLRRSATVTAPVTERLQINDLSLDRENRLAYRGDRTIELSEKETDLLAYLIQHPNQVLTHQQIHQHLWQGDTPPSSNVLPALVRLLRRKIEPPPEAPLIHTVYGKGYRCGL
ncbi:MAG: response regulator transcription factor [Spirulina sp. SIO3F2]|nr:response regulator transcription factor [Spirulina sp. SIO3F2]